MRDSTAKLLSAAHRVLFRATDGRVGRRLVANDMLLLTTRGRRSGRLHTVPLLYLAEEPATGPFYVVASWGGRDTHPEWFLNLTADPAVHVQVDDRRFPATAAPLDEPERSGWWARACEAYAGYHTYQARTERIIPVIRITPV